MHARMRGIVALNRTIALRTLGRECVRLLCYAGGGSFTITSTLPK